MKKYTSLSSLITDYRIHKSLTQIDFASLLDVDARSVLRWEKGLTQISRDKEASFAEILAIPFQVIRNLNSDPPIAIFYDIERKTYSHSAFASVIDKASFFMEDHPKEDDSVITISNTSEVDIINSTKKDITGSTLFGKDVLLKAAELLPELNLFAVDQSMYYSGHMVVLPISISTVQELILGKLDDSELTTDHLVLDQNDMGLFACHSYADSVPPAYYLMRRFFEYFKSNEFKSYEVVAKAYNPSAVELWKQTGLRPVHTHLNSELPILLHGDFDMFLFNRIS